MRHFELVEGSSSKFWQVEVSGSDMTVTFGRIGTAGQSKIKTFADNAAAQAEADKLIREKTKKGYSEVGGEAASVLPPPATATTQTAPQAEIEKPAKTEKAAKAEKTEKTATPAPSADLGARPDERFHWTPALEAEIPPMRGVHMPPLAAKKLKKLPDDTPPGFLKSVREVIDALVEAGGTEGFADTALVRDTTYWQTVLHDFAANKGYPNSSDTTQARHVFAWMVESLLILHGGRATADLVMAMLKKKYAAKLWDYYFVEKIGKGMETLRQAIALLDEADYEAVKGTALDLVGKYEDLDAWLAYLFPGEADLMPAEPRHSYGLVDYVLQSMTDVEQSAAFCIHDAYMYYSGVNTGNLLLLTRLHGAGSLPFMAALLARIKGVKQQLPGLKRLLKVLSAFEAEAAVDILLDHLDDIQVFEALHDLAPKWPLFVLEKLLARRPAPGNPAGRLLLALTTLHPAWKTALEAQADEATQQALNALFSKIVVYSDAADEELPEYLRHPAWENRRREELPSLSLTMAPRPTLVHWGEGEQERTLKLFSNDKASHLQRFRNTKTYSEDEKLLIAAGLQHKYASEIARGALSPAAEHFAEGYHYDSLNALYHLSNPDIALAVWNAAPPSHWNDWQIDGDRLLGPLARWGEAALPGFMAYVAARPQAGLEAALRVETPVFAPVAAHAFNKLKKIRPLAVRWLKRYPETAAYGLLPEAFGKGKGQESARQALRWLNDQGEGAALARAAAAYGEAAQAALEKLLATESWQVVPAKMPKLPTFLVASALPRPVFKDSRRAIPLARVPDVLLMLAISKPDEPYAGAALLKDACTADSLGELSWEIFRQWLSAGAPAKENWMFTALGLYGNDEAARRLTPMIRAWPGEAAHARAVAGLAILAAIGTDVALMHLNGIAEKVKFKGLQAQAREQIERLAEDRGLTSEQLADRLVPDLDLDERGTLLLDFGPRQFTVAFDETLKPFVKDSDGNRLKDLPKPNSKDDAEQANAASERYKALKKDARAIASLQINRLEQAMCLQRRWTGEEFEMLFVRHPLLRHLTQRLIWGAYDADGRLTDAFRVAEDLSLLNRAEDAFDLPAEATVGIAHVLEMPADLAADFGQILADYTILQPFQQLGRQTYALSEDEKRANAVTRFAERKVSIGSVMGLVNRGWRRGDAEDGGWIGQFTKNLGPDGVISMALDPGLVVGDLSYEPIQKVKSLTLNDGMGWQPKALRLDSLNPVLISEVLRDAELLAVVEE